MHKDVVWHCALASNVVFTGNDPALDTKITEKDLDIKGMAEERMLHRMAKV
jgi:hypothetical protein